LDIRLKRPTIVNYFGHDKGIRGRRLRATSDMDISYMYAEGIYEDIFSDDVPDGVFEFPEEDNTPYQYQDPFEFSSELEVRAGYKMLTGEEPTAPEQYTYYNARTREVNEYIVERRRVKKHWEERRLREKKEQRELYEAICEEFDRDLTDAIGNLLLGLEVATDE
jgi:hypothetical protein